VIINRVIYKITGSPNQLFECISEPLNATKYVSNFLSKYISEPLNVTKYFKLCNIEWFTHAF